MAGVNLSDLSAVQRQELLRRLDLTRELADRFKFARQKSKLAGTIRGSYFVIKNEY